MVARKNNVFSTAGLPTVRAPFPTAIAGVQHVLFVFRFSPSRPTLRAGEPSAEMIDRRPYPSVVAGLSRGQARNKAAWRETHVSGDQVVERRQR